MTGGVADPQRVGIIGAGVAGLQVAAALTQAGLQVTLFEKSGNVGGVWQKNYTGYSLQVQRWHYDIPGYSWPKGTSYPYPTGEEVQSYLEAFARDSGLLPLVHFNTEVQGLTPLGSNGDEGWMITYTTNKPDGTSESNTVAVGFLVVATGLFNIPLRPDWATHEALAASPYQGQVVDARDFTDVQAAKGKHVIVVGAGKTAIDVAVSASQVAASTTLLARRGQVWAPQKVLGFIPFEWAVYTRWSWALQPAWYTAGLAARVAHKLTAPIKAAVWKVSETLFPLHTATPKDLVHPHSLLAGVYDTIGILPAPEVRKAFRSGALAGVKGEVAALTADGVQLTSGETIKADLIVLATGYQNKERELLPEKLQTLSGYDQDGNQWLYRNLLPVGLQNLAYVGLNATFQHVLTTALQARWLTAMLTGEIKVPSRQQQVADIQARREWLQSSAFPFKRSNNFVWAQHGKFHDQLVADLGYSTRRKGWNVFAEFFAYIKNQDFVDVVNLAPKGARSL